VALETPVALFIFNRPDLTQESFQAIAAAKPQILLIIADGPRSAKEWGECAKTRQVVERIDWDCEVFKNYSNTNLGCKQRVISGLKWVFEQFEEAIILEDDCVAAPSFFRFCSELLERYRYDERITTISGDNFQFGQKRGRFSYYFSTFAHIWGWASWRRAWKNFDSEIHLWPELRQKTWLLGIFGKPAYANYWQDIFDGVHAGLIDAWSYQWAFMSWAQSGLTILPNRNLISNIGFGEYATHTKSSNSFLSNIPAEEMDFPLSHPSHIVRDYDADLYTLRTVFSISERKLPTIRLHKFIQLMESKASRMLSKSSK
jgi:hypothetical protein